MTTDISTIEQELTAAIVKAVPEIESAFDEPVGQCPQHLKCPRSCRKRLRHAFKSARPITLEDVLRAMQKIKRFGSSTATYFDLNDVGFEFGFMGTMNWTIWDFGKPLSDQSEETKRFLHSLLCQ